MWPNGYKPNENTILFLPMEKDLLDHWPNNLSITNNGNVELAEDIDGAKIKVWKFSWWNRYLSFTNITDMSWAWTVCLWAKVANSANKWMYTQWTTNTNTWLHLWYSEDSRGLVIGFHWNDVDSRDNSARDNRWHLFTFTYNWWWRNRAYVDWAMIINWTKTGFRAGANVWRIWTYLSDFSRFPFDWYMSNFILESRERDIEEIQKIRNIYKKYFSL